MMKKIQAASAAVDSVGNSPKINIGYYIWVSILTIIVIYFKNQDIEHLPNSIYLKCIAQISQKHQNYQHWDFLCIEKNDILKSGEYVSDMSNQHTNYKSINLPLHSNFTWNVNKTNDLYMYNISNSS